MAKAEPAQTPPRPGIQARQEAGPGPGIAAGPAAQASPVVQADPAAQGGPAAKPEAGPAAASPGGPSVPAAFLCALPSTKRALYNAVQQLRQGLGITCRGSYPLSALEVAAALHLRVEQADFKTPGLRGAALPAQRLIILDQKLSKPHKNFYCAHELCHHLWHSGGPGAFRCYDMPAAPTNAHIPARQNQYLEWQANEGAAELLVPLRILLPTLKKYQGSYESDAALRKFTAYLAAEFHVPHATIELRLESLKYEIRQYLAGIPLKHIAILSNAQQQKRGIRAQSLPAQYLTRLP